MTHRHSGRNHLYQIVCATIALMLVPLVFGASRAQADTLIGLTTTGGLVSFDSNTPGTVSPFLAISGLLSGESILAIDRRPANGLLFGLGSTSRLYTINTATGSATAVGVAFAPSLTGTAFGMDFNPTVDRIRVVSSDTSNFRLNPNTGAIVGIDSPLTYVLGDSGAGVTPRIVGSAYTNNFDGAAVTTLFGIDSNRDVLVMQGGVNGVPSPNGGTLTTIGSGLGFNTSDLVGFDISGTSGTAFAAMTPATGGASQLFTINLTTGAATLVGTIGTGLTLVDIAADVGSTPAVPETSSFALLIIGVPIVFALGRRYRKARFPSR